MAFLDEVGLEELWKLIQAEDAKGVKIATGSYTGTGTFGNGNKNSLTFDFEPKLLIVKSANENSQNEYIVAINGQSKVSSGYAPANQFANNVFEWSGKRVSWYSVDYLTGGPNANAQMNASGNMYQYFAVGY